MDAAMAFISGRRLERLEFDALGALLGVDGDFVLARANIVRKAMSEWRNPELLFRYLDDNRHDARMYELITRWLRSIFGLSNESLRMIRRESGANVRHLLMIPQEVGLMKLETPPCSRARLPPMLACAWPPRVRVRVHGRPACVCVCMAAPRVRVCASHCAHARSLAGAPALVFGGLSRHLQV